MGFEGRQHAHTLPANRIASITDPADQTLQQVNPVLGVHGDAPSASRWCAQGEDSLPHLVLGGSALGQVVYTRLGCGDHGFQLIIAAGLLPSYFGRAAEVRCRMLLQRRHMDRAPPD